MKLHVSRRRPSHEHCDKSERGPQEFFMDFVSEKRLDTGAVD